MKNGQIFDLTKAPKITEKHQNHYKNTLFSFLCRRKNYILNAYAGVRSFCSSCNFGTKKTPFSECFFFTDLKRQFNSINIACRCRLLISLLYWLWLLITLLLLWLLISLLLLCRLLNLLSLLILLISDFC